jgi:hypothetical protein
MMDHVPPEMSMDGTWRSANEVRQAPSVQDTSEASWRGNSNLQYNPYNNMPMNINQWNVGDSSYHQPAAGNLGNASKPFNSMGADGMYMNMMNVKQELPDTSSTITGLVQNQAYSLSQSASGGGSLMPGLMSQMLASSNEHMTNASQATSSLNSAGDCDLMMDIEHMDDDVDVPGMKDEQPDVHNYIASQLGTKSELISYNINSLLLVWYLFLYVLPSVM